MIKKSRLFTRILILLAGGWMAVSIQSCGSGLGPTSIGVGNTPNVPPSSAYQVLGQPGLGFSGIIFDAGSSWTVQGTVPLAIVLVHNTTPTGIILTKQSAGNGLLSVQLTDGFTVLGAASTSDPFGTVTLQDQTNVGCTGPGQPTACCTGVATGTCNAPGFTAIPSAAYPDVRFLVKGPPAESFQCLIEDTQQGFQLYQSVPSLFLYEHPNGKVDGNFNRTVNFGSFVIDLVINGAVVSTATGGPTVSIQQ